MHEIVMVGATPTCAHCPMPVRLASWDEARLIHDAQSFSDDGPWKARNNIVVVPVDFSIFGA